jgi:hypothetical protein
LQNANDAATPASPPYESRKNKNASTSDSAVLQHLKDSMDHLMTQMDTLTQTVILLEQRLSLAELKISDMAVNIRNSK